MTDRLSCFLIQAARAPFAWGKSDCGLFLADWVLAATGHDPARDLRAAYACANTAAPLVGSKGLPGLVTRLARSAGLQRGLARGSVAVVRVQLGSSQAHCGAIYTGSGWALRQHRGLVVLPARPVVAFKVPV